MERGHGASCPGGLEAGGRTRRSWGCPELVAKHGRHQPRWSDVASPILNEEDTEGLGVVQPGTRGAGGAGTALSGCPPAHATLLFPTAQPRRGRCESGSSSCLGLAGAGGEWGAGPPG